MGKVNLSEEQKKMIEELRKEFSKDQLYELLIQDKEEQPRKDKFWQYILLGFILLSIVTFLVIVVQIKILSFFWIYFLLPFLAFLLVNRTAYSNGKPAIYGKELDILMVGYYVIIYCVLWYYGTFSKYQHTNMNLLGIGFSLYCVVVLNYAFVKIIEKKFYGRRNAVEVKKFLFFKTKYDLDLLDDIIKSNIWMIDEIEEFEEHSESDRGKIFRLSDFLRLSTVSTDKCMSIGVSKESGKYIFQDEQTIRIQEKIGFILEEVLNFKKIEGNQVMELEQKHKNLWFSYTDTPSKLSKIVEERKDQVTRLTVITVIIILGLILISKMPSDSNTTDYLVRIWITIISAILAWVFTTRTSKQ